jgi:hypothetical protein
MTTRAPFTAGGGDPNLQRQIDVLHEELRSLRQESRR